MIASSLRERVTFQKRADTDDGMGNPQSGPWVDQFTVSARIQPLKGTERVMASRLQGIQPVVIQVRVSAQTRQIAPHWKAVNAKTGTEYAIRGVANMDEKNRLLDILAESGVAP